MAITDIQFTATTSLEFQPGGVVLAELAHADDEFEIAHGLAGAAAARDAGLIARVMVHYATDSAASSNPGHRPNQDRTQETLDSLLSVFGIPADDVMFGDLPDGTLSPTDPTVVESVLDSMRVAGATDVLTLGAGSTNPTYPNHSDHSAVHQAVLIARDRGVNVWGLGPDSQATAHATGSLATKLAVMTQHGSQFTAIDRAEWPEAWGANLPTGWRLVGGFAVDAYTAGVLDRYQDILHQEHYVRYPKDP
ncbi:MAG TPA: PIG-L family deacetylase [Verrucomicrobiae bacterium]|nr:PIG-L family deacetylase [Verrucomicrobiae bacterium]